MGLTAFSQPVTVRIIAPPEDPTGGLGDVLLGSLGLTGVMVLVAIAAGAIFAGVLFYIRSRQE
jgi:ABC-type phosphate transport system permease subunit